MRDLSSWGFSRDLEVEVSPTGTPKVTFRSDNARVRRGSVYASFRDDGLTLKTGLTRMSIWDRWSGTLRVIGAEPGRVKLRENEWRDRDQWRNHVLGRSFSVWSKPAATLRICYAEGLPEYIAAIVEAEERYVDALLKPVIGKPLDLRGRL